MSTISQLQSVCAAYHRVATSALTVGGVNLFLVALNNAKNNAQKLHNFEAARVTATLDVDGVNGGSLDDAVIDGESATTLTVTGTLSSPDPSGTFTEFGLFADYPLYMQSGAPSFFLYYCEEAASYILSDSVSVEIPDYAWVPATPRLSPAGTMAAQGTTTGTATVTATSTSRFSGISEVTAIQRTNTDGVRVPLDFTRADIAIERDRYELELSEEYEPYRRWPSDAQLLDRGSNGTLIQRGRTIYVYPLSATSSSPLSIAIEGYGNLADYTSANLSDATPTDFLIEHGAMYMQWAAICELNYLFKTFVQREEGNLTAPEAARDNAWRDLVLWDSYLIDPNSTRSR